MKIPIGVSNRHIHLSQKDADILFGENYKFNIFKELSQPGQFAYQETITIKGPKGEIKKVRILGPVRNQTQLEIFITDNYKLGINAPLRISGDLNNSEGNIELIGPKGTQKLNNGVIVALRHLHISTIQAEKLGLKNKQTIKIKTNGPRSITFHNVIVRISDRYNLDFHIDREEGDAAGISQNTFGEIIKQTQKIIIKDNQRLSH